MSAASAAAFSSSSSSSVVPTCADESTVASASFSNEVSVPQNRGIDVITGPEGDLVGISISQVAQVHATIDKIVASPRLVALPIAQRYALAGIFAAAPSEHARVVEKLASHIATSLSEAGALNSLYILETCKDLVPGFKEVIPAGRLETAAELSSHDRIRAAIFHGQKPPEWQKALKADVPTAAMFEKQDDSIFYGAGRAIGDATKLVGGATLGGVGIVTDTLGLTDNAESGLADAAEGAVDVIGDTLNDGFDRTARDIKRKGVIGAVGDSMSDAVDLVTDFVGGALDGIAGGVQSTLDWVATDGRGEKGVVGAGSDAQTHRVTILVAELFGEEKSLGLRIESRVITKFTKQEAEKIGWKLCDCIIAVGTKPVTTQEDMLSAIAEGKEALKSSGVPLRFLVERLGGLREGPKKGDLVFVSGRPARIQELEPQIGTMQVQYQDDATVGRVALR